MAGLDVLFFARFKVHCEVMHVRIFSSFKLILSRHTKELRGAPKTRGPRPRPIWPMRKSVTEVKYSGVPGVTGFCPKKYVHAQKVRFSNILPFNFSTMK